MGLRALERRLVLLRSFLAVRDEVDRYLDLAKKLRRLPGPADLTGALRNRGLDPPGLLKGRNYLAECITDGMIPHRDDLVCRILGMEDCWLANAIEESTPPEFRGGQDRVRRSIGASQSKQLVREFNRSLKSDRDQLFRKVREVQAQAKAAAAEAKTNPDRVENLYERIMQVFDVSAENLRRESGATE